MLLTPIPPRHLLPLSGPSDPNWSAEFPTITGGKYQESSSSSQGVVYPEEEQSEQGGKGPIDWVISKLPGEFHMTDMGDDGKVRKSEYCGPGTDLAKRLARGDPGINELDREGCKPHDIWYRDHPNAKERNIDDRRLAKVADRIAKDPSKPKMQRNKAKWVRRIMNGKVALGLGITDTLLNNKSVLLDVAGKVLDWGLEKLSSRKSTPTATMTPAQRQYIKRALTAGKRMNKEHSSTSPSTSTSTWNGLSVYKPSGKRKTQKELEDEFYLGIKPQEGGGKRKPKR